ncbi:MAG: hypothetical protein PHC90_14370 [Syntrophorhabdaceae bacterium]|nr:hypothetical protein [Syntrophorhabdaceae bacterium]
MKDLEEINGSELVSVIKILNKSGFLEKEIRTVGVKKKDLLEHFADAYEGLDAEAEEKMLKDKKYAPVIDFYEDTFSDELGNKEEGKEAEKEEEEKKEQEKPAKKEKKEKPAKKEKAPKEKKEKEPVELSRYGHKAGTKGAELDELFYKGDTLQNMADIIGTTLSRVNNFKYGLIRKGWKVECVDKENKIYKVTGRIDDKKE